MKQSSAPEIHRFNSFDPDLLRISFPKIEVAQLSSGQFRGWLYSSESSNFRITAGSFNQSILCDGHYNEDTLHIGFILSQNDTVVVQAREYDNGAISIHRNTIAMHEVFPANLSWVDIAIPEKKNHKILTPAIIKKLEGKSQAIITGSRESLSQLIQWADEMLKSPTKAPDENEVKTILHELLFDRMVSHEADPSYSTGDRFKMHILNVTHDLAEQKDAPLSLANICEALKMRPRTVQQYFHEIYGMGPTEYFRVRRLNDARAELLKGDSKVSAVAYQCNFFHLGRFAARYKTHFGESPKDTVA